MKKIIVVFGVCFCIIGIVKAQVSKTVNVNAGGLYSALTANQRDSVTNLTLTGTIDARDFVTMRDNLPYLAILDLSNVDIAAYSGKLGTNYTNDSTASYLANTIPQFAFLKTHINNDYPMLTTIIMLLSLTAIGKEAFETCFSLTSITISSSIMSIGIAAFVDCIGPINVDANNPHYSSID